MKILVKILGTVLSLLTGWLGTKVVSGLWKTVTGEQPPAPNNPEFQQEATLGKVLTFAIISGASAAVIQAITKRWTRDLEAKAGSN